MEDVNCSNVDDALSNSDKHMEGVETKYPLTIKDEERDVLNKYLSAQTLVYDPLKAGSIDGTDVIPHDRAISRAMVADYRPSKRLTSKPENTLFIGRLKTSTTEDTVHKELSSFGPVKSCHLVRDVVTGFSKGYAFVEFENERSASIAYRSAHRIIIDDKKVLVDFECERLLPGWVPRRLGGGFGGKKDSGQLRFGSRDRPVNKPINIILHEKQTTLK